MKRPDVILGPLSPARRRARSAVQSRERAGHPKRNAELRAMAVGAAHLAVLWMFAVAQPLLDLLGRNPTFFAVRDSSGGEIVLFVALLVLLVPLALALLEFLVAVFDVRARRGLHLLLVAVLFGTIVLHAVARIGLADHAPAIVIAAAGGVGLAALYRSRERLRSFLTVLTPAVVVFPLIFLLGSPVSKLILPSEQAGKAAASVKSDAPVVMILFDELPIASLMNRDGQIDARRYPNFARLADASTWYRNTTTVGEETVNAIPALLSGKEPKEDGFPLAVDYPDNIFTSLGDSRKLHVDEPVTSLCPQRLCPDTDPESSGKWLSSVTDDLSVVYGHLVLPDGLAGGLPSVTGSWRDFGGKNIQESDAGDAARGTKRGLVDRKVAAQSGTGPVARINRFARSLRPPGPGKPPFYFLHVNLPHVPWTSLPSGQAYTTSKQDLAGLSADDVWSSDRWQALQGYQRHLLQTGLADRMLGRMLDRLREQNLFDDSLVVVAADHGVAFTPGEPRRRVERRTAGQIGYVPLFIKAPSQATGRTVEEHVELVDVVPSIAQMLGAKLAYKPDGRSFLAPGYQPSSDAVIRTVKGQKVRVSMSEMERQRSQSLAQKIRVFGEGTQDLRPAGPHPEVFGRSVQSLRAAPLGQSRGSVDTAPTLQAVDLRSDFLPVRVTGRVTPGDRPVRSVAVALNGTVAATGATYAFGADRRFSVIVPRSTLRQGVNGVEVFAVDDDGRLSFRRLTPPVAQPGDFRLVTRGRRTFIRPRRGRTIDLVQGPLDGKLDTAKANGDLVQFAGWSGDVVRGLPVESVMAFAGSKLLFVVTPNTRRADVGRFFKKPRLAEGGFDVVVPASLLKDAGREGIRLFGVRGVRARELNYPKDYKYRQVA